MAIFLVPIRLVKDCGPATPFDARSLPMKTTYRRPSIYDVFFLILIGMIVGAAIHAHFGPSNIGDWGAIIGAIFGTGGAAGVAIWIADRRHRREREHAAIAYLVPLTALEKEFQCLLDTIDSDNSKYYDYLRNSLGLAVSALNDLIELGPPSAIVGWDAVDAIRKVKLRLGNIPIVGNDEENLYFHQDRITLVISKKTIEAAIWRLQMHVSSPE